MGLPELNAAMREAAVRLAPNSDFARERLDEQEAHAEWRASLPARYADFDERVRVQGLFTGSVKSNDH